VYQQFEEAGTDLAQLLGPKNQLSKAAGSMEASVAKALGKLSSGLYVVTAAQSGMPDGAKGAMVASWVAQASFQPLGLTVAVAKDRAIESLMQVKGRAGVQGPGNESRCAQLLSRSRPRLPPPTPRSSTLDP